MAIVKKASKLFEGLHRHKNELRSPLHSRQPDLNDGATGRIGKFVAARKSRQRRSTGEGTEDASLRKKRKAAMAQEKIPKHYSHGYRTEDFCKTRIMADAQLIHTVEDEEEEAQSEASDESESEDEVDESVVEDMRKLEESFRGISRKYRLINRIGEGDSNTIPTSTTDQQV